MWNLNFVQSRKSSEGFEQKNDAVQTELENNLAVLKKSVDSTKVNTVSTITWETFQWEEIKFVMRFRL